MNNTNELPNVLTAKEIAAYLKIGYTRALHLIRFGGIPHIKINHSYRVFKDKFFEWCEDNNEHQDA